MPSVLITGSGRRLGRGLALEFARNNWDVVIHYNESEQRAKATRDEILSMGMKSVAVKADMRSKSQLVAAFDIAFGSMGIPDVLVNNAGIFPQAKQLSDITEDLWRDVLNVNLRGVFYASQIFAKHAGKGARIINIASLGGSQVWKHRIPYNVSKAGVIHLTKALAKELAPDISVNGINPGSILIAGEPGANDQLISPDRIPMKRHGTIKDIFDVVYFFATASQYITGQIITVDGGFSLNGV